MTLLLLVLAVLGVTSFPPPPGFASLEVDFDNDGFRGTADCSPFEEEGHVRWCYDLDFDGDGEWKDGDVCLPADGQPIDSRLVLSCE